MKSQQSRDIRLKLFQAALDFERERRRMELRSNAQGRGFDAILIDRDPAVRELWRLAAGASRKTILILAEFPENRRLFTGLDRSVPFYLDTRLPLAEMAQAILGLRKLGFQRIHLTSPDGMSPAHLFLGLRTYGKIPPWPLMAPSSLERR